MGAEAEEAEGQLITRIRDVEGAGTSCMGSGRKRTYVL